MKNKNKVCTTVHTNEANMLLSSIANCKPYAITSNWQQVDFRNVLTIKDIISIRTGKEISIDLTSFEADKLLRANGIKANDAGIIISNSADYLHRVINGCDWSSRHHKILLLVKGAYPVGATNFRPGMRSRGVFVPHTSITSSYCNTDINSFTSDKESAISLLISIRKFARIVGVDESTVRGHIKERKFSAGVDFNEKGFRKMKLPEALVEWTTFGGGAQKLQKRILARILDLKNSIPAVTDSIVNDIAKCSDNDTKARCVHNALNNILGQLLQSE